DVTLGVLECLTPAIIGRDALNICVRHFDVETMNAVVFDLEVSDAGALALAPFEVDYKFSAVGVDGAKLVELGVIVVRDDTAVAQLRRRFGTDASRQYRVPRRIDREICGQGAQQRWIERSNRGPQSRKDCQRVTESCKIARPRVGECDPRYDALDIDRMAKRRCDSAPFGGAREQRIDGVMSCRCSLSVA